MHIYLFPNYGPPTLAYFLAHKPGFFHSDHNIPQFWFTGGTVTCLDSTCWSREWEVEFRNTRLSVCWRAHPCCPNAATLPHYSLHHYSLSPRAPHQHRELFTPDPLCLCSLPFLLLQAVMTIFNCLCPSAVLTARIPHIHMLNPNKLWTL